MLDQFKEQELSNVVWAFAKLHHYDSDMFRKLLAAVSNKLPHFQPQVGRPRFVAVQWLESVVPANKYVLYIPPPCPVMMRDHFC